MAPIVGPPRPLAGTWRDLFAQIYEAFAHRGITAREVDEHEIWEVAAMLGANRAPDPLEVDADWNERRAWALEHGLPEPQWSDVPELPFDPMSALPGGLIAPTGGESDT